MSDQLSFSQFELIASDLRAMSDTIRAARNDQAFPDLMTPLTKKAHEAQRQMFSVRILKTAAGTR
jgi:hypothetical protein